MMMKVMTLTMLLRQKKLTMKMLIVIVHHIKRDLQNIYYLNPRMMWTTNLPNQKGSNSWELIINKS